MFLSTVYLMNREEQKQKNSLQRRSDKRKKALIDRFFMYYVIVAICAFHFRNLKLLEKHISAITSSLTDIEV